MTGSPLGGLLGSARTTVTRTRSRVAGRLRHSTLGEVRRLRHRVREVEEAVEENARLAPELVRQVTLLEEQLGLEWRP